MCVSRLYRVVAVGEDERVEVEDAAGARSRASLLAYDGGPLRPGEWVVAHSGYVLERVDRDEAASIVAQIAAQITDQVAAAPSSQVLS